VKFVRSESVRVSGECEIGGKESGKGGRGSEGDKALALASHEDEGKTQLVGRKQ